MNARFECARAVGRGFPAFRQIRQFPGFANRDAGNSRIAIEPPGSRRVDFRAENSRFLRFGGSWKRFFNKIVRLTPLSFTKHSKIGGNRPGARVTAIGPQNCAIFGPKTTKMPGPEAPKLETFENQNSATIRCAMTRGTHF